MTRKQLAASLGLAAVFVAAAAAALANGDGEPGYVNTTALNLRASPGTGAASPAFS